MPVTLACALSTPVKRSKKQVTITAAKPAPLVTPKVPAVAIPAALAIAKRFATAERPPSVSQGESFCLSAAMPNKCLGNSRQHLAEAVVSAMGGASLW